MSTAACWWEDPRSLRRYVRDVLAGEMARLRPGGWTWPVPVGPPAPDAPGASDLDLVRDLGADSLELLQLSTALAEAVGPAWLVDAGVDPLMGPAGWPSWADCAGSALRARQRAWSAARGDPAADVMTFQTSGSTGAPRRVEHDMAALREEMADMAAVLMDEAPVQRLVCAVRSHHIYGFLFSVLLPQACARHTGSAPPVWDVAGLSPAAILAQLQPGDAVIGYPDWWRAALGSAGPQRSRRVADGVIGLSSTAPCPDELSAAAVDAGLAQWVQIYGSTETAGVGWRRWPAPYRLFAHWRRVDGDHIVRSGSLPVLTPDHLRWLDDDAFVPIGRRDGVVQVGGVNVSPEHVRRVLLTHPGVADAAVRPVATGASLRLKAYIVPRAASPGTRTPTEGPEPLQAELGVWMRQHLEPAARPVSLTFGPHLPVNEAGKPGDWLAAG